MSKKLRRKVACATSGIALLFALGALAPAAVAGTLSYEGDALVFTAGDDLDHELAFRYDASTGRDHILDTQPITSGPGDCQYEVNPTWVSCPGHLGVRVSLGGGSDRVYFHTTSNFAGDCFLSYRIDLGNGSNENTFDDTCTDAATATVTAGSGDDRLRGGSASTSTTITAGGGNDSVDGGDGGELIHGGDGSDGVFGNGGNDQVYGEGGNDRLRGGDGNDLEDGGPGDDDIGYRDVNTVGEPDPGADLLRGGDGADLLRLDGHGGAMAISLDGAANDGTPGEGDNVGADIEMILGTSGNDVFAGSAGADGFDGGQGSDEVRGAGGDDHLVGSGGDDRLFGDAGNDQVEGQYGTDTVDGGAGTDKLYGDVAGCSVFCEPDIDFLLARDGERDIVNCGGPGTATVDRLDVVGICATVNRAGALAKARFTGSKRTVKVSRKGRFTYSFRTGARLRGNAAFRSVKKVQISKRGRVTLARKSFRAPASGKVKLSIKLTRKNLAILRRNGKVKTRVTVTLRNAAGLSSVASALVTLKR